MEKYGRSREATDDNVIRPLRFACLITKATDINSEYVMLIAFPLQHQLHKHTSLLGYMYIACLVMYYLEEFPSSKLKGAFVTVAVIS